MIHRSRLAIFANTGLPTAAETVQRSGLAVISRTITVMTACTSQWIWKASTHIPRVIHLNRYVLRLILQEKEFPMLLILLTGAVLRLSLNKPCSFQGIFNPSQHKLKTPQTHCLRGFILWSHLWDSNPRPADYKCRKCHFTTSRMLS